MWDRVGNIRGEVKVFSWGRGGEESDRLKQLPRYYASTRGLLVFI